MWHLLLILAITTLGKGQKSKTKAQVTYTRSIGPAFIALKTKPLTDDSYDKYLSMILVFCLSFGLWSGNFFLIAPFHDHCRRVPLNKAIHQEYMSE